MKSLKRNIVIAMMMLLILITIPTVSKAYVNYRHGCLEWCNFSHTMGKCKRISKCNTCY